MFTLIIRYIPRVRYVFNTGIHATFHSNNTLTPRSICKTFRKIFCKARANFILQILQCICKGYHLNFFFTASLFIIPLVISFATSNYDRSRRKNIANAQTSNKNCGFARRCYNETQSCHLHNQREEKKKRSAELPIRCKAQSPAAA